MDLCFELATQLMARIGKAVSPVDEVHGFRYFDDRDLIGFVDGTENPRGAAAVDAVLIGEEDPAFAGGSYVIVQKYLHDLDAWNALSTEAQERIIGRTKLSDIELDDSVKPTSAHNALTTIEENGKEVKILRDNMPFGQPAHRSNLAPISSATAVRPAPSSRCSRTCSSAGRPATTTACSTSAAPSPETCSSCPPRPFWTTYPKINRRLRTPPQRHRPNPLHHFSPSTTVRSASVPLKETSGMNNLHRELAPISDSAWAEIEEETSRTLKRYLAGRRVVDVQGPGGTFLSAVGTGHLVSISAPGDGIVARQREVKPLVELRVPFELDRQQIDDVDRGANDSDWQPAKGRRATDRLCRG